MKLKLPWTVEICGGTKLGRKLTEAVIEALPSRDVSGLDTITLLEKHKQDAPLGRYYDSGHVLLFMRWFQGLEQLGVQVIFGKTVVHEVGHHKATHELHIEDLRLNEIYARTFEIQQKDMVKEIIGTDEELPDTALARPIDYTLTSTLPTLVF